jgi:hypothetical protein
MYLAAPAHAYLAFSDPKRKNMDNELKQSVFHMQAPIYILASILFRAHLDPLALKIS